MIDSIDCLIEKIPKNSKIAIWGVGAIAQKIYNKIKNNSLGGG